MIKSIKTGIILLAALLLAWLLPWCYAAVGVHPHDTKTKTEEIYEKIRRLAGQPKVQTIGEIGLDYFWEENPPPVRGGPPVCAGKRRHRGKAGERRP